MPKKLKNVKFLVFFYFTVHVAVARRHTHLHKEGPGSELKTSEVYLGATEVEPTSVHWLRRIRVMEGGREEVQRVGDDWVEETMSVERGKHEVKERCGRPVAAVPYLGSYGFKEKGNGG